MRTLLLRWLLQRMKPKSLYLRVAWEEFEYQMHTTIALDMAALLEEDAYCYERRVTRPLPAIGLEAPRVTYVPPWQAQTSLVLTAAIDRYATQPIPV